MISLRELGAELKVAREARELSLESLSTELRIKLAHLQAIELGNEAGLPEPVYVKIFVRKFAQAVGLDGDALSAAYWATHAAPQPEQPQVAVSMAWWVVPWVVGATLLGGVITLVVLERQAPSAETVATTPTPVASAYAPASVAIATDSVSTGSVAIATDSWAASGSMPASGQLNLSSTMSGLIEATPSATEAATVIARPSPMVKPRPHARPRPSVRVIRRPQIAPHTPGPTPSRLPVAAPQAPQAPDESFETTPAPPEDVDLPD